MSKMKIYRALKTNQLSATFYSTGQIWTNFGLKTHGGMDWSCYFREPIFFDCDKTGEVIGMQLDRNLGLGIEILTEDESGVFKHRFWHFDELKVAVGQKVESGTLLGYGDSTGYSTGNHLHRDLKPQTRTNGILTNTLQSNGTYGATDPMPYFSNIYIKDYIATQQTQIGLLKQIVSLYQKIIELMKMKITLQK